VDASLPKIRRLRATPVNVPLARPHPTASGVVSSAPLVLMDLETDQGLTGHAYVFCYTPIALKPIADLIEALQPLIQEDAVTPLVLAQKLQGRFRLIGPQGFTGIAMAAIDMAAWDVFGEVGRIVAHPTSRQRRKTGSSLPQSRHGWAGRSGTRSSRIDRGGLPVREV
jgi:L-alanine-DL-glutamate epimerase-like enolase superfamily enzyme